MAVLNAKNIYMIGICGMGMTALAQVLQGWGKTVSGSDARDRFLTDAVLERLGIPVVHGFDAANVPDGTQLVVASSAYTLEHPEVARASAMGIPIMTYGEALAAVARTKRVIAIAGTHGKSTTTAMVGVLLERAGLDPTVIVGTMVRQWGTNARVGRGEYLVVEADEYQGKFLSLHPDLILLTSIDWDHPDYFTDPQSYTEVFRAFVRGSRESAAIIGYGDDVDVVEVLQNSGRRTITYGRRHHRTIRIIEESRHEGRQFFWIMDETKRLGPFSLSIAGDHMVTNAAGALAAGIALGVELEAMRKGLAGFEGTERRMETIGELPNGAVIVDDYAHHPVEVSASLQGLCEQFHGRPIHVIFQGHTYTRTKVFLDDFAHSFAAAASVVITDIFASAREQEQTITPQELVGEIAAVGGVAQYVAFHDLVGFVKENARAQDVWVLMGAGDGWRVARALVC